MTLKTGNADYLQLVVDGQVSLLSTQSGSHVYTLASGLASGEHTVTVWRRTEPNYGTVEAGPLTFDGTLLAPVSPKHRIEVIGDSITVGFGVECKTNSEAFAYATENNYLSYEALTARKFSADVYTEAWSGMGLWRDVGGGFDQQMPIRYVRVHATRQLHVLRKAASFCLGGTDEGARASVVHRTGRARRRYRASSRRCFAAGPDRERAAQFAALGLDKDAVAGVWARARLAPSSPLTRRATIAPSCSVRAGS